jgi:predicted dehydrogenase
MGKPVRVLILGTGGMANSHVEKYKEIEGVMVVAGVDTRPEQLAEFCSKHGIGQSFTTLDAALAWGAFDAVSNVTPDPVHYPTTLPLLKAGKHVLCEKPLATNEAHAAEMAAAAQAAGVVNMVNLTYRNVAAMQAGAALVRDGAIGTIKHFEASYLQSWLTQPAWGHWDKESQWLWRLSTKHGSKGVLGDVGIHILDFALYVAGIEAREVSCRLATFHKAPGDRIGEYPLDANDSCTLQLVLDNGALGTVSATRFATGQINDLRLRLYGDEGGLEVQWEKDISRLRLCNGEDVQSGTWRDIEAPVLANVYQRFIEAIRGEMPANPDFARAAMLQRILDRAEQSSAQNCLSLPV